MSTRLMYYALALNNYHSGSMSVSWKLYTYMQVHSQLNVYVSQSLQIADFGLSRDLSDENYYISHGGKVPVKWTAPEALDYRKYSTASDVWSYGCLLYEIWSLGIKPFCDLTNNQVGVFIVVVES